ncbi:hypothetical protein FB451DRAFT_1418301 [Mycena latifolia]|nr:hypothetical protein FB451DRAFT_1418301 [Mycena latifolia]
MLIVTCRGQQRAFSRTRAAELFVTRFARADDFVETPPGTGWLTAGAKRRAPAVEYLATFCRPEPGDGVDTAPIPLDASGWAESIGNLRMLEVVLTRRGI